MDARPWLLCFALIVLVGCGGRRAEPPVVQWLDESEPAAADAAPAAARLDRMIHIDVRVITAPASVFAACGVSVGGAATTIDAATEARLIAAVEASEDAEVIAYPRMTMYPGQRAHSSFVQPYAFLADYAVRDSGALDPRIDVLTYGQVLAARVALGDGGHVIDELRSESLDFRMVACEARFSGFGDAPAPFEEPIIARRSARCAPGTVLREGRSLVLPVAAGIARATAQARLLALDGVSESSDARPALRVRGTTIVIARCATAFVPEIDRLWLVADHHAVVLQLARLERRISCDRPALPLAEAIGELARLAEVDLRLDALSPEQRDQPVALVTADGSAADALRGLLAEAQLIARVEADHIAIGGPQPRDFPAPALGIATGDGR